MKKLIALLLALTLLCALFIGCGNDDFPPREEKINSDSETEDEEKEIPVITVCLDLPLGYNDNMFFSGIPGNGTDYILLTETIPSEGAERESTLSRVRTEILAGKGPDMFICFSWATLIGENALFPFPRQTMENRVFLPLDGYIEQAKYMEWDKLLPQVMAAGHNGDGQLLLPLTYQMDVFLADSATYTPQFERPSTWYEMVESGDPTARELERNSLYSLGVLADYENDVPAFTEEELLDFLKTNRDLYGNTSGAAPLIKIDVLDGVFSNDLSKPFDLGDSAPKYWMLSGYNTEGGITASVISFAGINRNTQYPDEAFHVLDFLLDKRTQANSGFYKALHGLPVHMDLYSKESPLHGQSMSDWNFQKFSELREQINAVDYFTPLGLALGAAWRYNATDDELREMVHKQYVKMQMLLGES